jgi:uncharacterized membrane protein YqjE
MPQTRLGIADELSSSFASARGLLSSLLDLFTLEARRAGLTLALMLGCGALAAILVAAAWFGLMAAVVLGVASLGIRWEVALAATALANLGLAVALSWVCYRVSRDLLFSGTRRQLRPARLELV